MARNLLEIPFELALGRLEKEDFWRDAELQI